MSEELSLVSVEKASQALANVEGIFNVDDTVKGVTGRIPQIKIVHQAQMFVMGENKSEKFDAIIIHHTKANAFWAQSFSESGGGVLPDCFSMNGETPVAVEGKEVQANRCATCKQNQFGSDGSRGKACKNMWRLHLILPGQTLPKRLTLPPSSLNEIQDFLISLRDMKIPNEVAVVEFSLKKDKNKDGIEYSKVVFKLKGVVNDREKALELKKIKTDFASAFGEVIDVSEYVSGEEQ